VGVARRSSARRRGYFFRAVEVALDCGIRKIQRTEEPLKHGRHSVGDPALMLFPLVAVRAAGQRPKRRPA